MSEHFLDENIKFEILIVDDIPENLQLLANILSEYNIEVSFATSGMQGLEVAKFQPPDLILLDISMPEMDGYEVCKTLKANDLLKDIPVIFLTALKDPESVVKGFEYGAVDYITKPFNPAELMSRVFTHLELSFSRKKIKEQNLRLLELNASKDKFFSIISHDLKNPFNTLIGFSDILIKKHKQLSSDKITKFYHVINSTARQGYALLENLLEWSRSQMGSIIINKTEFCINSLIDEVLMLHRISANEKQINIIITGEKNVMIFADQNMIKTVLRNLISNAIKFTNISGEIIINCKKSDKSAIISIKDNGIGIKPENLTKIFRFEENISTEGTMNEKGTGFGLVLSKEFINKNGGELSAKSEYQKGSEFKITIPLSNT